MTITLPHRPFLPYHQRNAVNDWDDCDIELGTYGLPNTVGAPPAYSSNENISSPDKAQTAQPATRANNTPLRFQPPRGPVASQAARISDFSRRQQLYSNAGTGSKRKCMIGSIIGVLLFGAIAFLVMAYVSPHGWMTTTAAQNTTGKVDNHIPAWSLEHRPIMHKIKRDGAVLYEAARASNTHNILARSDPIASRSKWMDGIYNPYKSSTYFDPNLYKRAVALDLSFTHYATQCVPDLISSKLSNETRNTNGKNKKTNCNLMTSCLNEILSAEQHYRKTDFSNKTNFTPLERAICPTVEERFNSKLIALAQGNMPLASSLNRTLQALLNILSDPSVIAAPSPASGLTDDMTDLLTFLSSDLPPSSPAKKDLDTLLGFIKDLNDIPSEEFAAETVELIKSVKAEQLSAWGREVLQLLDVGEISAGKVVETARKWMRDEVVRVLGGVVREVLGEGK